MAQNNEDNLSYGRSYYAKHPHAGEVAELWEQMVDEDIRKKPRVLLRATPLMRFDDLPNEERPIWKKQKTISRSVSDDDV